MEIEMKMKMKGKDLVNPKHSFEEILGANETKCNKPQIDFTKIDFSGINYNENFDFQRISERESLAESEKYFNSTINENVEEENMSSNLNSIYSTPRQQTDRDKLINQPKEINFFKKISSKNFKEKKSSGRLNGNMSYFRTEGNDSEYMVSSNKKPSKKKFLYSESLEKILNKNLQKEDIDFISAKQDDLNQVKQSINFNLVEQNQGIDFCNNNSSEKIDEAELDIDKENIPLMNMKNLNIEIERIKQGMIKKTGEINFLKEKIEPVVEKELRTSEEAEKEYYPEVKPMINPKKNFKKVSREDLKCQIKKIHLTVNKFEETSQDKRKVRATNTEDYQSAKYLIKKQLKKLEKKFRLLKKKKQGIFSPISKSKYSGCNSSTKSKQSLKIHKTPSSFITKFCSYDNSSFTTTNIREKLKSCSRKNFSVKKWVKEKSTRKENMSFANNYGSNSKIHIYKTRNSSFKRIKNFMKNNNSVSRILKNLDRSYETSLEKKNQYFLKENEKKISKGNYGEKPPRNSNKGSCKKFMIQKQPKIRFDRVKKSLSRKKKKRSNLSPLEKDKNKLYSIVRANYAGERKRKTILAEENFEEKKVKRSSRVASRKKKKESEKFSRRGRSKKRGTTRNSGKSRSRRRKNNFLNQFSVSPLLKSRRDTRSFLAGNQVYSGNVSIFPKNLRNFSKSRAKREKSRVSHSRGKKRNMEKTTPLRMKKRIFSSLLRNSKRGNKDREIFLLQE